MARMQSIASVGVGVVGYGYWGPNLVRNILESSDLRLRAMCERDPQRAAEFARRHPHEHAEPSFDMLLLDPRVDAVVIATPPSTHYELARRALEAGKHVLVEKPLATSASDATELIRIAESVDRVLMPGHTFLYSPPVNKIRELIQDGELGDVFFVTSTRMNLGRYQSDGVVCDLAPHDLSILLHWLDLPVAQVAAVGRSVFRPGVPETAFVTVTFAGGVTANIQLSWLAPRKVRQMVVVGSKRMVQYEDMAADEAVRVYDRGLEFTHQEAPQNFGEYQLTYRTGDMVAPRIDAAEPLALELTDFAHAIRTGASPRSSVELGLEVVRALEAANTSMEHHGVPVSIERDALTVSAGAAQDHVSTISRAATG